MSAASEGDRLGEESRSVAAAVREELARRRISRQQLAERARISLSTLEKALSGRRPFTLATTVRLEEALGVPLRKSVEIAPGRLSQTVGLAPEDLGSYARPGVSWLEGSYLTLRPSFGCKDAIYAYRTEIAWDEGRSSLIFRESERLDVAFAQDGVVSVPNQSGHIYLVTNKFGQFRLITVARPTISGVMYGILATLLAGRGSQLTPVATPIAFVPAGRVAKAAFGRIDRGQACYEPYRAYLKQAVDEQFALFLPA